MENTVVVGAQWGDEGKAKITDLLAENADIIIRYQGGCNAWHTVVNNGKTFKFHLIPSGILYKDKLCFIGAGTVICPEVLNQEIEDLKKEGIDLSGLKISPLASIDDTAITLEEIKRMKQEMLRLQEENEILKKAMTTFPSSWG